MQKGAIQEIKIKDLSTDADNCGGLPRSRAEASVMEVDRRGRVILYFLTQQPIRGGML